MTSGYAKGTTVSVVSSRLEIERLLEKFGAGQRMVGVDDKRGAALVLFTLGDRQVRFTLELPKLEQFAKKKVRGYLTSCSQEEQRKLWEQACRQRWRALLLSLKAKLVAVEEGVESVEVAFYAHVVLANNQTVWEATHQQVEQQYRLGSRANPLMLPPAPGGDGGKP